MTIATETRAITRSGIRAESSSGRSLSLITGFTGPLPVITALFLEERKRLFRSLIIYTVVPENHILPNYPQHVQHLLSTFPRKFFVVDTGIEKRRLAC